ncbi:MAG: hypothetical protein HGB30_09580 [Holophagaceae bacterium]|nr:hypothetical protein [Holophagaceae bacterium]
MKTRLLAAPAVLLIFACTAPKETVPPAPPEPFVPRLTLRPVAVSLAKGATQSFQVEINYPEGARYLRQPVSWGVLEATGGTINPAGLYTAPATAGTFHVRVTREDFPEIGATATVTVK